MQPEYNHRATLQNKPFQDDKKRSECLFDIQKDYEQEG